MKINKIENYTCEYCGKTYSEKEQAMQCEDRCKKKVLLEEEHSARKNEIENDFEKLSNKLAEYIKDYGDIPVVCFRLDSSGVHKIPPSAMTKDDENKAKRTVGKSLAEFLDDFSSFYF